MGDYEGSASGSQMDVVKSPTSRRPKPRVRDAISVEASESQRRSPSNALVISSASASPVQQFTGIKLPPVDNWKDDDEDDFFDRARRKKERIHSNASLEFDEPLPPFPDTLNVEDEKEQRNRLRSVSPHEAGPGFGRVKRKPYVSAWARQKSMQSKRGESSSQSNSDSSDEESKRKLEKRRAGSDILTSPITSSSPVKDADEKDAGLEAKRRRESKSANKSPTKKRPLDAEQRKGIRQIIESSLPATFRAILNEEAEKDPAMSDDEDFLNTLDPDLRRYVTKGKKATEKAVGLSRERRSPSKTANPPAQKVQAPSKADDRDVPSKVSPPTAHSSREPVDTIELSDSDDDFRPSAKTARGSSQSNGPLRRSARTAKQPSSSPPIFVSFSQKAQTEPVTDKAPQQTTSNVTSSPTVVSSDEQAISTSADSIPEEESAKKEEEANLINLIMKGGEGGCLKVPVRVRSTTRMEKLLDYFIDTHRDQIPSNRISKVRLRFDGDVLRDKDTVESIGIEDEEQLDVVW